MIQPVSLTKWLIFILPEKRHMKEKQVEQDIMNAAVKVFVEKGKDGARMQEIADAAGVNKMLLHYYFKDKDTLFLEVLKKIVADLYDDVFSEDLAGLPFKEFLYVFIDRHFDFLNKKKAAFQFLLWELSRNRAVPKDVVAESYIDPDTNPFGIISARLDEAAAKGEIRRVGHADFIMNLFSLDLFMFIALPVIREIYPMDDEKLATVIKQRKAEVFRLLWNDIKKDCV